MNAEFYSLALSREELMELHRAALLRYLVEEGMRKEQGLEPVDPPAILNKLETVLNIHPTLAHEVYHQVDEELWQHSWYAFTDEWAWFRARQDVMKKLSTETKNAIASEELETLVGRRYEDAFNRYVAEVDMKDEKTRESHRQKASRKTRSIKK